MPVVAGAIVVAGLMQYYNSEKARGATKDRLNQIEGMFNQIVPPDLNVKVWDDPKLVQSIPSPVFNVNAITPDQYKSVGQFVPEVAHYVEEANPQLVKASGAGEVGRQAQLDALAKYKDIAKGGFDPEFQQAQNDAAQAAQRQAQSRTASLLQDANRRGSLNSGLSEAAQLQGNSDAMSTAALTSQRAATDAYRNRLTALGQSAQLGGDIRNSDISEQARNAGIINDFNQRTSAAQQAWQNQRASTLNNAQQFNLGNAQDIANRNTSQNNAAAFRNQEYGNSMAQQQYQNSVADQARAQAVQQHKEALMQSTFGNNMAVASARAGVQGQQINNIAQNAQDQNNMIQGLGNAATAGAMHYDDANRRDAADAASRKADADALAEQKRQYNLSRQDAGYGEGQ